MADIREERIKRLQEIMSRRQDFASGKTVSDEETNNRLQTLDRVYNQRYLPQQADSWTSDFTAFAKKIQTDAQSRGNKYQSQDSLTTYRDSISGQLSDLIDRSKYAKKYAESSGNTAYQSYIDESIKYLTDIAGNLQKEQDYWGQWADEDAYKKSPAYFANTYNKQNDPEWDKYVEQGANIKNPTLEEVEGWGRYIGLPGVGGQEIKNPVMWSRDENNKAMAAISSSVGDGRFPGMENLYWAMENEEVDMYNYLLAKYGKDEADKFSASMENILSDRLRGTFAKSWQDLAAESPIMASLTSIPMNLLGGAGYIKSIANVVQGKDPSYKNFYLTDASSAIRDTVSKDMNEAEKFIYNTTMSIADSLASKALGQFGVGALAGSAAAQGVSDAESRGATHSQALLMGTLQGIAEGIFEYVNLESLGALKESAGTTFKSFAYNLIKEAIGEATEEMATETVNILADWLVMQDKSYIVKLYNDNINKGMSSSEAVWDVIHNKFNEILNAGLSGAVSGGVMGGVYQGLGNTYINYKYITTAENALKGDSDAVNNLVDFAINNLSEKGSFYKLDQQIQNDGYKLALQMQSEINAGGKPTKTQLAHLISYINSYIQNAPTAINKNKMTTDQYVSAQKAIAQIYEARTQAETKATQGAETAQNNVPANVLNNDIYNAVKAVQANEKAAVRQANIIARILNGDSSVSSAQIDEVSGKNSSVRNVLKSATGIDLGITNADARKAVKAYISEKAAAVNVQQPSEQAQESNPGMTAQQTEYDKTVKESDKLSAVFGEKGQAAYKEFSKGMKLSDSLLYFNDAFIRFYNQGVEAAGKKNSPKKYRDINGFEGISSLIKQRAYEAGLEDAKNKSGTIAEFVQKAHEVTEKVAQDEKEIKERQKAAKKVAAKQFSIDELAPTAGKWNVDPKIDMGNLSEKQSASLNYLKTVSEVSGINITLISGIDTNGDFSVENGYYDGTTNTVYVSINAGMQSIADITHSAMLKTAAHEITHYIAKSGTDAYTMLEDYIVNEFIMEYGKDGLARRISDIQEAYKDALNKDLTYEKAKEEMVANACEMMLKNSNTFEKLAMNNMTLAQKLKAGLDSFVSKFNSNKNAALEGLEATSVEARMLARSESSLKTAQKLWDNALKGAIKENQNTTANHADKMLDLRHKNTRQNVAENVSYFNSNKGGQNDGTDRRNESGISGNRTRGQKSGNIATDEDGRIQGVYQRFHRPLRQVDSEWQNLTDTQRAYAQKVIDDLIIENSYAERIFDIKGLDAYKTIYDDILSDNPTMLDRKAKQKLVEISQQNYLRYANAPTAEDAEYLKLAQQYSTNKDRALYDKLSKMVLKAADNAGYTTDGYHGTNAEFYEFVFGDIGFHIGTEGQARARASLQEGDRIIHLRGKFDNPLYIDMDFGDWHGKNAAEMLLKTKRFDGHSNQKSIETELNRIKKMRNQDEADEAMRKLLLENNYDSVKYINTQDVEGRNDFSYIALKSSQLKSAEPIVYDDGGNVVPLSQRFNDADRDIRFSLRLPDNAEVLAKKHFGRTARWTETGYLTTDGTPLDFSGRHWSPDHKDDRMFINSRQVDHMDIQEVFPDAEDYRKAQFAFVARGNIRIVPETAGINLAVKPTEKQASMLKGYFTAMKASRDVDTLLVDIDDANGKTVKTLEYPKNTSPTRIINDINAYFDGKEVQSVSDVAHFHSMYSLRNDDTAFDPRKELPDALLELAQNEKERNTLLRYKENADMLNKVQLSLEQAYAELKQAKAAMDGKRMREASEAVKKAENRLNIWDKKLTEMEATKPIKELIARRESQLKEQFARGSTTRAKYRNNIKKNIRSLDAKLRTNSGQKHILKELQPVIASLLDTFTNNTSVFTRDQLEKLKYAYAQFKPDSNIVTETNNTIINGYDNQDYENDPHLYMEHYAPVIADSINAIAPVIENMRLTDLDAETLAVLDNIVSNINHIVVHSEDIFINKKATELRGIAESSLADMKQSGYTRPKLNENGTASTIKSFFEYKNTLPVYVMERLGDTVMNKLWNPLQNGAAQMVREQVSDSEFLHSMMKKYDMQDWKDDTLRVTLESGQQIVVTQEQAMYIYAVAKRENTHRGIGGKRINHLGNGGIILPKIVKENIVNEETGKTEKYLGVIPKKRKVLSQKKGIPLTDADIDAISKRLSANQKNYVDEIVSYLSTTIADRGNEVSRQLYGIDLFNEKYYIPIMSSKDYLNISFMGQTEKLIKNAGMTKALTQGANNPIVIDDFSTVVAQHLLQMERYDSLAVPLDNFNRWLNYLSYDEDAKGRRTKNGDGVRVTMEDVYGAEMQQYINQLLKDANAASTKSNNENLANRLIGKFRKNAVLASLSVAIQQPSALGRAFTYISPKYFVFRTGWTHFKDNFNEMMKYADTAFIKENGSFDPAVSTNALDDMLYMSPEGWNKVWKLFSKDGKYRDELLGKLPKAMDRITWVSIWQAVKAETADKYGNLDTNSDEFLKIAGERFDYIINRTQVYDSILSKSELMRSKSAWWKSVTSFAAEPTVAYNVLLKGAEEVSLAKGQDAKAKRTAWRFFGRSVASFLTASFFNSLLKSIVTAARKDKDDDKSYLEWYAQEFVSNFIDDSSVFKLLPLIRDVASLFEGYDLTRTDMEMVTMIKDAVEAIADSDLPVGDKLTEIIKAVGIMTGIPAENIMRDTKALYNVIVDIFDGWQTSWEGIGDAAHDAFAGVTRFDWISESASTEDKLYAAMMNGDKNAYSKYYSMIEQEFNKKPKGSYKSAESYMRSEIRKRLKESEEIKKIYEARMALDLKTYNAIKQELMDKGFIENDIMSAVNLYKEALEKEQEQQESEVQNTTEPEEEKAYFDKDLLITALEKNNGSDVEIIEQMIGDYSNKRDPEYLERRKKIRSYITGYLKPKYQDAFLASDGEELRRIAKQLQQYKKYGINYTSDDLLQWRKSAKTDRQ